MAATTAPRRHPKNPSGDRTQPRSWAPWALAAVVFVAAWLAWTFWLAAPR